MFSSIHKKQKRNFVLGKPWSDKQTGSVFFKMFLLLPAAPLSTSLTENKHKHLSVSHTVSIDETKETREKSKESSRAEQLTNHFQYSLADL